MNAYLMRSQVVFSFASALIVLWSSAPLVCAQTTAQQGPQPAQSVTAPIAQSTPSTDLYPALRETADRLKAEYSTLNNKSSTEIEALQRTGRCQITRVGGLIDRLLASLQRYTDAELLYWDSWGKKEQDRVDSQEKTLATMEVSQKQLADYLEEQKQDREVLEKKHDDLVKYGKRTEQITREINEIIEQIRDSETKMKEAQQKFDDLAISIQNMRASITARLTEVRVSRRLVEEYRLSRTAELEQKRDAANEVCNLKQPGAATVPIIKRGN